MKHHHIFLMHGLQLFAEGGGAAGAGAGDGGTASGAGVTAAAAGSQTGDNAPAAGVQKETTEPKRDRKAEFDKLIKGEYKDIYDAGVQNILRQRFKGHQETSERLEALSPMLEILGKKYGVDPKDAKALSKAIEEDDSYFEEEAMDKGISVQELKRIRKMERENAQLRRQMQERQQKEQAAQQYSTWMRQAEEAKKIYPSLELEREVKDPQFVSLLKAGVDVGSAYLVLHKDDIIPAAMQSAAKAVEGKLAASMAAGGARPTENGAGAQSAAVVKSDVSKLTKKDRAEINRRVMRGERITLG